LQNNTVHRIGPSPVLQYRPGRFQTAPASPDRAQCDSASSRRCSDHASSPLLPAPHVTAATPAPRARHATASLATRRSSPPSSFRRRCTRRSPAQPPAISTSPRHLHVRRTPSSPSPALIRCELHAEDFPSLFHSFRAASFLCSPRA
jgi:hypothetical protein